MPRKLTQEEFEQKIKSYPNLAHIKVLGEYINYNTEIEFYCNIHKVSFIKLPIVLLQKTSLGCNQCYSDFMSSLFSFTEKEYIEKLYNKNKNVILIGTYKNTQTKVLHKCLRCGHEWNVMPNKILHGRDCPACGPIIKTLVVGMNDIATTHPDIAKILWNKDDANKYSFGTNKNLDFRCPECGRKVKNKRVLKIIERGLSCPYCSDGISAPNKYFTSFLDQTNIDFETETIFDWAKYKYKNKIKTARYDFSFEYDNIKYLVEVDGSGHDYAIRKDINIEDIKFADSMKDNLALENGYRLIRIKAYSNNFETDYDMIQKSINNSELANIINLDIIDWEKCFKDSLHSNIIKACNLWNDGLSIRQIGEIIKKHKMSVGRYLRKGAKLNLCDYTPEESQRRGNIVGNQRAKRNKNTIIPHI